MGFLLEKCKLVKLDDKILEICHPFTCGDADLDDFFQNDAMRYKKELLGKTYCFILDQDPKTIVCMFTLSNDSIRVDVIPIIGDVSCRKAFQERNVCVDTLVY